MAESPQLSADRMREYDLNSDLQVGSNDDTCSLHNEDEQERDPDYVEERFRVDRRKLEHMIQAVGGRAQNAEDFFIQVMEDTNTQITWPSKLKIGAKSKKDPHIKVSGHKDAVAAAKEKIMAVLDTKSTRVTLKMDVSHTEHSHVIGKGGNNIKKVMQETGCHIHFPDSNRNNQAEKSNQVSIAGQPNGVEQARVKIRELLPLVFMFELPMTGVLQPIPDSSSPAVQQMQSQYGVTITFKQRPRVYATMVIIRGSVSNAKSVKEATLLLIERLTGNMATAVPVSMQLEIAPQHHLFIIGRGGANIKQIMQRTGATIHFPDPTTVTPQRKGTVYITGPIDSVYCARNYLIGCLPLVLMFDMKEDVDIDQGSVSQLMEQLDVFISVKPKPKQPSKSVIVKSIERNAGNLYEARCRVLGVEGEQFHVPPSVDSYPNTSLGLQNLSLLGHNLLNVNTSPLVMLNRMQSPMPSPGPCSPTPLIHSAPMYSPLMVLAPPPGYSTLQSQYNAHTQNGIHKDLLQQQQSALARMTNASDKITSGNTSSSESPQGSPASCTSPHLDYNIVNSTASAVSAVSAMLAASNACGSLFTNNHPGLPAAGLQGGQPSSGLPHGTSLTGGGLVGSGLTGPSLPGSGLTGSSLQGSSLPGSSLQGPSLPGSSLPGSNLQGCSLRGSPTTLSSDDLRGIGKLPGSNFVDSMFPRHMSPSNSSVDLFGRGSGSPLGVHNCSPLGSATGSPLNTPSSPAIKHRSVLLEDNLRNLHFQNGTEGRSSESGCDSDGSDHNKAPGSNRPPKSYHPTQTLFPGPEGDLYTAVDYEKKKLMATKAMQKKPDGESRIPTDYWAGLGFSKSMPDTAIRERLKQSNVRYNGPTMTTTIEELSEELPPGCGLPLESTPLDYATAGRHSPATPPLQHDSPRSHHPLGAPGHFSSPRKKVGDYGLTSSNHIDTSSKGTSSSWPPKTDLAELFSQLGLGKYTDLFTQQEIDLATFLTLTDQDLKELGISTFGARRKMILAIQEYNKRPPTHSVAPGSNNPFRDTGASSIMSGRRHDIASQSGRW